MVYLQDGVELLRNVAIGSIANFAASKFDDTQTTNPKEWKDRVAMANDYFRRIDVIGKCIWLLRSFVVGDGVQVLASNKEDQEALDRFTRRIHLDKRIGRFITNELVRGEAIAHKVWDNDEIKRLQLINPLSVVPTWDDGELAKLVQYAIKDGKRTSTETNVISSPEQLANILFMQFDADDWDERGNSLICRTFDKVPSLEHYRRADRAIAKRFTNPLRLIRLGGLFGNKLINPGKKELSAAKELLENQELNQGLVVPWHWDVKTYGTDGVVLDTSSKAASLIGEIAIAMGFIPFFVTGEGSGYGNSRVVLKATRYQIRELCIDVRIFLDWLFDEQVKQSIGLDSEHELKYIFTGLDLDEEEWSVREDRELYDRGLISRKTLQRRRGLDPEDEDAAIDDEPIRIKRFFSAQDVIGLVGAQVVGADVAQVLLGMTDTEVEQIQAAASMQEAQKIYKKAESRLQAKASKKKKKTTRCGK